MVSSANRTRGREQRGERPVPPSVKNLVTKSKPRGGETKKQEIVAINDIPVDAPKAKAQVAADSIKSTSTKTAKSEKTTESKANTAQVQVAPARPARPSVRNSQRAVLGRSQSLRDRPCFSMFTAALLKVFDELISTHFGSRNEFVKFMRKRGSRMNKSRLNLVLSGRQDPGCFALQEVLIALREVDDSFVKTYLEELSQLIADWTVKDGRDLAIKMKIYPMNYEDDEPRCIADLINNFLRRENLTFEAFVELLAEYAMLGADAAARFLDQKYILTDNELNLLGIVVRQPGEGVYTISSREPYTLDQLREIRDRSLPAVKHTNGNGKLKRI